MARPSKLTQEIIQKAETYLDTCSDTIIETEKGGISYVDVKLPMVADLAIFLGVNRDTVYEWCKGEGELNTIFSDIVKGINQEQEKRLINKSLGGIYQPKTTGMLLAKHGYSDKQEIDHTTKGEKLEVNSVHIDVAKKYEEELKTTI